MRVTWECALFLLLAICVYASDAACAERKQSPLFFLDVAKPADDAEIGLLIRELVRQSVLLTAREELGLSTRDASLREQVPAGSEVLGPPVDVSANISSDQTLVIRISKMEGKRKSLVKAVRVKLAESELIANAVAKLEPMSRQDFRDILGQCGYSAHTQAKAAGAAPELNEEIEDHLKRPNVLQQFEAIRRLHALLRLNPNAPAVLAAIARGYAHLGTLTEVHWSPMHKVFKARALLYAERLVALAVNTDSLCTRAYVRALTGLHQSALDDLAMVMAYSNSGLSDEALMVEAYCLDDGARLAKLAESKDSLWLSYLQFIRAEATNVYSLKFQTAMALFNREGDCFRAADGILEDAPLGVSRGLTESAPKRFAASLYTDLADMRDLPDAVRSLQERPKEDEQELAHRQRLIHELQRPHKAELTEPSLQIAGNLIQDITFLQAWRRLNVERFVLAVNTDTTLSRYLPALKGHPYELFVKLHARDESVARDALIALAKTLADDPHYDLATNSMLLLLQQAGVEEGAVMRANVLRRSDLVSRDLLAFHRLSPTPGLQQLAAQRLREISPNAAATIAASVTSDWEYAASRANAWEREYATEPAVQDAFGERYLLAQQWEDAARCLLRRIDALPDHETYRRLALCYRNQDNETAWLDTMTKALELESRGLEDETIRVELARHFMKKGKLETAQKYADEAAESWAGWALQCAAECHDQMGDWKNAETYMKRLSERYENSQLGWYYWCRRTGRGDVAAARELAKKYLQSADRQQQPEVQFSEALFEYAEGHTDHALEILRQVFTVTRDAGVGLHAALLADEAGQIKVRDELLHEALQSAYAQGDSLGQLLQDLRNATRKQGPIPLDVAVNDWRLHLADLEEIAQRTYFVGHFLLLRGQTEQGTAYLQRAVSSPGPESPSKVFAGVLLTKQKIEPQPRRASEWNADLERTLLLVRKAYAIAQRDVQLANRLIDEALRIQPESVDAIFARGLLYLATKRPNDAVEDFTLCLNALPRSTQFLLSRASAYEQSEEFDSAIADYQRALEIDPFHGRSRLQLAMLLATCRKDDVRDGEQAVLLARQSMDDDSQPAWNRHFVLSAALAEAGKFPEAIAFGEKSLKLAPEEAKPTLRSVVELYRKGTPYRTAR